MTFSQSAQDSYRFKVGDVVRDKHTMHNRTFVVEGFQPWPNTGEQMLRGVTFFGDPAEEFSNNVRLFQSREYRNA